MRRLSQTPPHIARAEGEMLRADHKEADRKAGRVLGEQLADLAVEEELDRCRIEGEELATEHGLTTVANTRPRLHMERYIRFHSLGAKMDGEEMLKQAATADRSYGILDALYLRQKPYHIPVWMRRQSIILFPGTSLKSSDEALWIPALIWVDQWVIGFYLILGKFDKHFFLLSGEK